MDVSGISRFQTSADGSMLTVSESWEEDEGTYTCHATNAANTQTDTVTLNVIGKSHKRARAMSLNTITDILPLQFPLPSRPSQTVQSWKTPSTPYHAWLQETPPLPSPGHLRGVSYPPLKVS